MVVIAQPPNPMAGLVIVFGFMVGVISLLYIFRERKTDKLPEDIPYNYEGNLSNNKIDKQLDHNAYLHTLAPSQQGVMYGLHNDKRKKK